MTLQAIGQIDMGQIFTEYAYASHDLHSYYGLSRGLPTSGQISMHDFYGQNAFCLLTVGTRSPFATYYGYNALAGSGSITDSGAFPGIGGADVATVYQLEWYDAGGTGTLVLALVGSFANSNNSFKTLIIGANSFSRTSASYSSNATSGTWTWSGGAASSNPIGTSGAKGIALQLV